MLFNVDKAILSDDIKPFESIAMLLSLRSIEGKRFLSSLSLVVVVEAWLWYEAARAIYRTKDALFSRSIMRR